MASHVSLPYLLTSISVGKSTLCNCNNEHSLQNSVLFFCLYTVLYRRLYVVLLFCFNKLCAITNRDYFINSLQLRVIIAQTYILFDSCDAVTKISTKKLSG